MYLPNTVVHSSEADAVEFLELTHMGRDGDAETGTSIQLRDPARVQLSPQTRLDIVESARDYITKLVANRRGGSADVRSIIHELHGQITLAARHGTR